MAVRITKAQYAKLARKTKGKQKPFALTAKPPKKKNRSAAEWLAIYRAVPPRPVGLPTIETQRALFDAHDPITYRLWLPLGPSVDHYLIPHARNPKIWILTGEARAYQQYVAEAWRAEWNGWPPQPLACRLRLCLVMHFRQRRPTQNDLDGRVKPVQDAMQKAGVYANDAQIDSLRVERGGVISKTGGIEALIETIGS